MLTSTVRRKYRKGEVIFHEDDVGESLHLLDRGRAAIRVSNAQGDQVIINVIGPGSYFGEQALVSDNNHRSATVISLQPVETLALHRAEFDRLRAEHPAIDSLLVTALSERVNRLTDHLVEALFTPADKAGTSRPTANRVLQDLVQSQIIAVRRGSVDVLDDARLKGRCT